MKTVLASIVYCRVLEAGVVQPGDPWQLQTRPNPDGSIPAINRCFFLEFDPIFAHRVIQMEGVSEWLKEEFANKLTKQSDHWSDTLKE